MTVSARVDELARHRQRRRRLGIVQQGRRLRPPSRRRSIRPRRPARAPPPAGARRAPAVEIGRPVERHAETGEGERLAAWSEQRQLLSAARRGARRRCVSSVRPPGDQPSAIDEGPHLGDRLAEPADILQPQPAVAARLEDARRPPWCRGPARAAACSRSARLTSTGNCAAVAQRPGELRVDLEVEHAVRRCRRGFRGCAKP